MKDKQPLTVMAVSKGNAPMCRVEPLWSAAFECGATMMVETRGIRYTSVVETVAATQGPPVCGNGASSRCRYVTTTLTCGSGNDLLYWPWFAQRSWTHETAPATAEIDHRLGLYTGLPVIDAHIAREMARLTTNTTAVSVNVIARTGYCWSYGIVRNLAPAAPVGQAIITPAKRAATVPSYEYARQCGRRLCPEWIKRARSMDCWSRKALLRGIIDRCGQLCTRGCDAPRHGDDRAARSQEDMNTASRARAFAYRAAERGPPHRYYYRLTMSSDILGGVLTLCRSLGLIVWTTGLTENVMFIHSGPTDTFFRAHDVETQRIRRLIEPVTATALGTRPAYRLSFDEKTYPHTATVMLADGTKVTAHTKPPTSPAP